MLCLQVSDSDYAVGRMYPPLSEIRDCSVKIAKRIAEEAYTDKVLTRKQQIFPILNDLCY